MSESGDSNVIGNFRKLIDEVSADAAYNPSNDDLKIPALEAHYRIRDWSHALDYSAVRLR